MKAKEIIDEGALGSIGKALQKVGGSMVAKSAAKVAEPAVEKGSGIAGKAFKVGKALATNPIKTAIGYNILTDPDKFNNSIPTTIGNAIGNTYRQGKQLAGAAWDAATRDDDTAVVSTPGAKTSPQQSAKPSAAAAEKEFDHGNDQPSAAPEPESDSYVQDMERRIQKNFNSWPGEQNESVKKKSAVAEAENVDIDKELEKHFPDPYVRRAIAAKVSRESGGKNVGEVSYRNTSNDRIREKFPQLRRYSDSQLTTLKKDDKQFFDTAYSKIGGYQYRGRGPIQITGRANYERLDKDLGLNGALVKDPDLLLKDPAISKAATVQYLKNAGLNKTYNNQKDAHRAVITAIGGSAYAPGTQLGKSELAAVSGNTGVTRIAGTPRAINPPAGGAAKPSSDVVKPLSGPSGEKLVQMPDFSQGFKSGDKFIPQTKQGYGEPVDYKQAYTTSKQSMGLSRDEAMKLAAAERQATQSNQPYDEPAALKAIREPALKTLATVSTPSPGTKDDKQPGSWNKVATTNAPLEEQNRITESINKEIQDILRLSGKR